MKRRLAACDPADGSKGGETQITGYTRRRARGCTFGRGFDSPRLHNEISDLGLVGDALETHVRLS